MAGLYIHVPFCLQKCRYCAFYSTPQRAPSPVYLKALGNSLQQACRIAEQAEEHFETLYFGGGTPSLLPLETLQEILAALPRQPAEVTLEVNPGTVTREVIGQYRALGITRLSLGIQTLDPALLKHLGRIHSRNQALQVLEWTTRYFENFSVDIMFALPWEKRLKSTLQEVLKYAPSHISAYGLSVEPDTPLAKAGTQIDEVQYRREYLFLHDYLTEKGYCHYEVSNFAFPDCRSRHNENYWKRVPYLGIGPAAHSLWKERRFAFEDMEHFLSSDLDAEYHKAQRLGNEEIREERIMLAARTVEGVERRLLRDIPHLEKWQEQGLLDITEQRVVPTIQGWLLLNSLIVELL